MYNLWFIWLLLVTLKSRCYSVSLRPDWKTFIDPAILQQYLGKDISYLYGHDNFEGDISGIDSGMFTDQLAEKAKNVINDEKFRWENGVVPYEMSSKFRQRDEDLIQRAMAVISSMTYNCIKFIPHTDQLDYVRFLPGFSCYSNVGRQGGEQIISYARGCMQSLGDIQHEILHALGFFHEISRFDRDQYVSINWDNIDKENVDQFKQYSDGKTFGMPYDYLSIMHYPFNAFAVDNQLPTIIPTRKRTKIGQNKNLSALDVAKIQMAYQCQPAEPAGSDSGGELPGVKVKFGDRDWTYNCDFPGNDIKMVSSEGKDCGPICMQTETCTHFKWCPANGGQCLLKSGKVDKSDAVFSMETGALCGLLHESIIQRRTGPANPNEIHWQADNWAFGCDFPGNTFKTVTVSGDHCGPTCGQTVSCSHFKWSPENGGTCYLKSGRIGKQNAIADVLSNVCGVV